MSEVLDLITLNCWELLDGPSRIFPVEIAKTESVGALKKAIKKEKENRLHGIESSVLGLWKASK